jgi:hypothetical protein
MGIGKHVMEELGKEITRRYGVPFHVFIMNGGHLMETEAEIQAAVPGWLEGERLRIKCSRIRQGSIP